MLLAELVRADAAARNEGDDVPPFYSRAEVHWEVTLGPAADGKVPAAWQRLVGDHRKAIAGDDPGVPALVPAVKRGSDVVPAVACDTAEYTFGLTSADDKPSRRERVRAKYKPAYAEVLRACDAGKPVWRVMEFVADPGPLPATLLPRHRVAFVVDGMRVHEGEAVQKWWAERQQARVGAGSLPCLVCGKFGPTLRVVPYPILGLPGARLGKADLIAANAPSTQHNGKAAAESVQICEDCAAASHRQLNALLRGPTRVQFGKVVTVFWSVEDPAAAARVAELFALPEVHNRMSGTDAPVNAVSLYARGPRVVPLAHRRLPEAEFFANLRAWYGRMTPAVPASGRRDAAGRWRPGLLESLAPAGRFDNVTVGLAADCVLAMLDGGVVPASLRRVAALALRRGDDNPTARAVLGDEGEMTPEQAVAYRCGRLLAVLDRLHSAAVGGGARGLGSRYFRSASQTPAMIFADLLAAAQVHLEAVERKGNKAHRAALADALADLDVPTRFSDPARVTFLSAYTEASVRG